MFPPSYFAAIRPFRAGSSQALRPHVLPILKDRGRPARLTAPRQFDILQSGPGWRGPNALRSTTSAGVRHAARRRGGGVAARGTRAANGDAGDRVSQPEEPD